MLSGYADHILMVHLTIMLIVVLYTYTLLVIRC
jgi:hypothetical protein